MACHLFLWSSSVIPILSRYLLIWKEMEQQVYYTPQKTWVDSAFLIHELEMWDYIIWLTGT